ncbi:MAG: hypothetical protein NTV86_13285 [Planctomycetota bacterium]|nr:hypothetical protein [Planctomycetota bacterium]
MRALVAAILAGACVGCAAPQNREGDSTYGYLIHDTTGLESSVLVDGKEELIQFSKESDAKALRALSGLRFWSYIFNDGGDKIFVVGKLDLEVRWTPSGPGLAQSQVYREFTLRAWYITTPFTVRVMDDDNYDPEAPLITEIRQELTAKDFRFDGIDPSLYHRPGPAGTRPTTAPAGRPLVELWDGGVPMINKPPFLKFAVWTDGVVAGLTDQKLAVWRVEPQRVLELATKIRRAGWFDPPLKYGLVFPDGPALRLVARRARDATTLDYHGADQQNRLDQIGPTASPSRRQVEAFVAMWNAVQSACNELADPKARLTTADPDADLQRAARLTLPPHSTEADTVHEGPVGKED